MIGGHLYRLLNHLGRAEIVIYPDKKYHPFEEETMGNSTRSSLRNHDISLLELFEHDFNPCKQSWTWLDKYW